MIFNMSGKIKPNELWNRFIQIHKEYKNTEIPEDYYFCDNKKYADELAELVKNGIKTATSSLKMLYDLEKEELPKINDLSIITDFTGNAIAIIKNTKVDFIKFFEVTEEFASKEGEGNKSLEYWRKAHIEVFTKWLKEFDILFDESMEIVYESFEVLFTIDDYQV